MAIDLKRTLPRPAGHHSLTPGMAVPGADKVLAFLEQAFGGKVLERYDAPGRKVAHAEVLVGDSVVMLGEASPEMNMTAALSYYVPNGEAVDATYRRALEAGATVISEPKNQFYGYRSACVRDAGGNRWTICAVIEELTKAEIAQRMKDMK
jgi:PhnB protein